MRIAIISDVHSNLEALEKTLELIKRKNIDKIVCLGDIVGYGANPNECLSLIRESTIHVLLGNHDDAAVSLKRIEYFNTNAKIAARWTNEVLTDENKTFIRTLQFSFELCGLRFTHSSPFEPEEWHYILSQEDVVNNFNYFSEPICFFGHTHCPGIYGEKFSDHKIEQGKRFLINVGSVGQPRDHDCRLSFGIFDSNDWTYENIRSEYDVKTASEKILKAGLPKQLAERILVGR